MPDTRHVKPRNGDVLLLVGTMKGAFILRAGKGRAKWEVGGPYFPGCPVYAMAYDGRAGRHRLWAAPQSWNWGTLLHTSDNFGKTWKKPDEATVKFPEGTGAELKQIWQIAPGRESEPKTLYCGVEPASGGYQEMKRLLEVVDRPTAVFAVSDRLAAGAMRAVTEAAAPLVADFTEGVRVSLDGGWVLVLPHSSEPLVSIYAEGSSAESADAAAAEWKSIVVRAIAAA